MAEALLESRITGVTVYRGWARVERTAELPAGAGAGDVTLAGLPLTLDDASIQVRVDVDDGGGAVPVATGVRVGLATPPPPADPPADLQERLKQARRAEQRLQEQLDQVRGERHRAESLALPERPDGPDDGAPPPSPLAARRALLGFQGDTVDGLVAEERKLRDQLREARRARKVIEAEIRTASSAGEIRPHELRKQVAVGLAVDGTGAPAAGRLVVSYLVPGVRWAPSYRLQFDGGMSRVRLAVRAAVAQRTGEDWSDVALTLSTADAQRWTELPKLQSVRIGRKQPPPAATGWREPPVGAEQLYEDHDGAFGGPAPPPPPTPEPLPQPADEPEPDWDDDEGAYDEAVESERLEAPAEPLSADMPKGAVASASMAAPPSPMPTSKPAPKVAKKEKARRQTARLRSMRGSGRRDAEDLRRSADYGAAGGAMAPEMVADTLAAYGGELDEDLPGALTAAANLLDYGGLRMAAAAHTTRGRLQPLDGAGRYAETLHHQHRAQLGALIQAIHAALQAARVTEQAPLPPGCTISSPPDGFDYAYPADAPVTLPSDGQYHTLPLTAREGGVRQRYVTVPRESQDVFRFVEWRNPLGAPLLAGPADVYVGGDYLTTTSLQPVPAEGEARLGLGVEQGIAVARNTRFEEDTSGMLGGTLNLHHAVHIELRNNLAHAAHLEVRERLPVTPEDQDDAEVKEGEVAPAWQPYDPDDYHLLGGRKWEVTVEPGAKLDLHAAYTIVLSSKDELVGGNRREQ